MAESFNTTRTQEEAIAYWSARVEEYSSSGIAKQQEWCAINHINNSQFSKWKNRLRRMAEGADLHENEILDVNNIVEITELQPIPTRNTGIEQRSLPQQLMPIAASIEYRDCTIHVYEHTNTETLKKIMEVLGNV